LNISFSTQLFASLRFRSVASSTLFTLSVAAIVASTTPKAQGHGFAGKRFFPATLTTDDPFVADELSLPTVSSNVGFEDGRVRETEVSWDLAKRITPNFGLGIGQEFTEVSPEEGDSVNGWGNLELSAKYQLFKNEDHEAIVSIGIDAEIGGTGRKLVGADSFSTWSPAVFFGKGFNELPDSLAALKPLALTGQLGVSIPGSSSTESVVVDELTGLREIEREYHPDLLNWGFALEYSIPYLQQNVKNIGIPKPFDRMIPVVEFAFQTALDRGVGGQTTGSINPGVIWSGKYFQIGAEAVIPINSQSGSEVGFVAQLHFYLDDLCPAIGRPIFGKE
jgi:hypothetical protein